MLFQLHPAGVLDVQMDQKPLPSQSNGLAHVASYTHFLQEVRLPNKPFCWLLRNRYSKTKTVILSPLSEDPSMAGISHESQRAKDQSRAASLAKSSSILAQELVYLRSVTSTILPVWALSQQQRRIFAKVSAYNGPKQNKERFPPCKPQPAEHIRAALAKASVL